MEDWKDTLYFWRGSVAWTSDAPSAASSFPQAESSPSAGASSVEASSPVTGAPSPETTVSRAFRFTGSWTGVEAPAFNHVAEADAVTRRDGLEPPPSAYAADVLNTFDVFGTATPCLRAADGGGDAPATEGTSAAGSGDSVCGGGDDGTGGGAGDGGSSCGRFVSWSDSPASPVLTLTLAGGTYQLAPGMAEDDSDDEGLRPTPHADDAHAVTLFFVGGGALPPPPGTEAGAAGGEGVAAAAECVQALAVGLGTNEFGSFVSLGRATVRVPDGFAAALSQDQPVAGGGDGSSRPAGDGDGVGSAECLRRALLGGDGVELVLARR